MYTLSGISENHPSDFLNQPEISQILKNPHWLLSWSKIFASASILRVYIRKVICVSANESQAISYQLTNTDCYCNAELVLKKWVFSVFLLRNYEKKTR